jgi:hypothetical protein
MPKHNRYFKVLILTCELDTLLPKIPELEK